MPATDADTSKLTFESVNLDPETFQVLRFDGEEQLSQPFRFVIELVSDDPAVALADVVNQPATLSMQGVAVHGVVEDMQQRGHAKDQFGYQVVLVPHVALLGLTFQSRIFQEMTVEDIVKQVLEEGGLSGSQFRFELDGSYPTRLYTVQYQETDLNFVSRLLEHEGIWFYFEHPDDGDVLVMTDSANGGPPIEGESALPYNVGASMVSEELTEAVREFVCRERVVTGKVVLKDYNYETPDTELVSESQINGEMPGVRYEYGPNYPDQGEGDRLAKVRNEEIECQRKVMFGDSDSPRIHMGLTFSLEKHYRDDLNTDYVFTKVRHMGRQSAKLPWIPADDSPPGYRNEFTCIPTEVPYRPPRVTPIPRLPGILTAKVETAGGDYAYIDDMGRYKVKMPFDLSDAGDGAASPPIRMAQPYSGPGYGMHMPNHAGTEMVWACVNGDLDRPLALSTVPNPSQGAPVTGGNNTFNMMKTASNNVIALDDTKGSEQMNLSTPYNNNISCGNDQAVDVGNNQTISVAVDRSKTVGSNQSESVGADKSISVGGSHTEDVGGDMSQTIAGSKTETVGADKSTTIGASLTQNVGASKTESIATLYSLSVGAAMNEAIGAAKAVEIGGALVVAVGGPSSETAGGGKTITAGGNVGVTAGANMSCSAGSNVGITAGGKASLTAGGNVAVSGANIVIEAKSKITLKAGGSTITLSGGGITIKGSKVGIKGSGAVTIKGSTIKQN